MSIGIEISQLMNQITMAIEDSSLGLNPGQIDLMQQMLGLIQKMLSDGLDQDDIKGLIHLMSKMSDIVPQFSEQIDEIVKDLKKLDDVLFEQDLMDPDSPKLPKELFILLVHGSEEGIAVSVNDDKFKELLDSYSDDECIEDPRFAVVEKMLTFLMDKILLSDNVFDTITKRMDSLTARKQINTQNNDNKNMMDVDTVQITPVDSLPE